MEEDAEIKLEFYLSYFVQNLKSNRAMTKF